MKIKSLALLSALLLFCGCHSLYQRHADPVQRTPAQPFAAIHDSFQYRKGSLPKISAHRAGGMYAGYPENCLESMQHLIPYGVRYFEIDIAKTADGKLVLLHDSSLDRTTNGTGLLADKTYAAVEQLRLKDRYGTLTRFRIPLFSTVLKWAKAKGVILMVDRKKSVSWHAIVRKIESTAAAGHCVLITYTAKEAQEVHHAHPNFFLSVSMRNDFEFEQLMRSGIPPNQMVAFTGTRLSPSRLYDRIHRQGMQTQLGTLGNLDKKAAVRGDAIYRQYARDGIDIFATDRPIEVARALGLLHSVHED